MKDTPPVSEASVGARPVLFPNPEEVRRILVCQLRQMGDVLLATPSVELLARHFPKAEIHFFTEQKCLPLLEGNPHIHTLWPLDKKALPTLIHELVYYRKIASQGFDLVVDFQQLPRIRWVVAFSRAKVRLTFPPPWYLRPLYTHWEQPTQGHAVSRKAGILAPLGIHWNGERQRMYLTQAERDEAAALLASLGLAGTPFITVDPTHRRYTRRWPAAHFAALMDMMAQARPDLHFFLTYGPGEEEYVRDVRERCACKERVHVPPRMTLRLLAACMERAVMHIGNCSAPRHMAAAMDLPALGILGATSGGWTFPAPDQRYVEAKQLMDMPCQNCNKNTCPYNLRCLTQLTAELVFPIAMEHLERFGRKVS